MTKTTLLQALRDEKKFFECNDPDNPDWLELKPRVKAMIKHEESRKKIQAFQSKLKNAFTEYCAKIVEGKNPGKMPNLQPLADELPYLLAEYFGVPYDTTETPAEYSKRITAGAYQKWVKEGVDSNNPFFRISSTPKAQKELDLF